jgi:enoyl-CoA hydratase/carnithine racemase
MSSPDDPLYVTHDGSVATLWLNRPAKRNAVTYEMWRTIPDVCTQLGDDPSVRVLVVRGVGDHFCAGADIADLDRPSPAEYGAANRAAEDALATFPKPTVAFIIGSCVGGGAEIAIACDLRVADTTARFGITPARLGIVYPAFAVERAVRVLGPATAKLLLFTGEIFDAERAARLGLVHEVHSPDAAGLRLAALTNLLAAERSLLSQMASKAMIDAVADGGSVPAALTAQWSTTLASSTDRAEGVAAFRERRPPRFTWVPPADGGPRR